MHYVVLCQPRTGSTYLTRLLRSHPGVVSHGELFHPKAIYWADRPAEKDPTVLAARDADHIAFLRAAHAAAPPGVPVGFKIFPQHSSAILEHVRATPGMLRITLRRDNLLAQFSSALIAESTGRFTSPFPGDSTIRIAFDEPKFLRFIRRVTAELELLAEVARPPAVEPESKLLRFVRRALNPEPIVLDLEYADLFAPGIDDRLTGFVGVAPRALRADHLVRQNPGRIVDRFLNPDDVLAFLDRYGRPEWAEERIER